MRINGDKSFSNGRRAFRGASKWYIFIVLFHFQYILSEMICLQLEQPKVIIV